MTQKPLSKDEQFFYDHAGYSHKTTESAECGHRRCAKELARAEAKARKIVMRFDWQDDERAYCYCDDPTCLYHEGSDHEWETLYVVAYRECQCSNAAHKPHRDILGSLGGIIAPDSAYRRVVGAELAAEHFVRSAAPH